MKVPDDAKDSYYDAADNIVTVVQMDFLAYEKAPFMDPAERGKMMIYYRQDLERLKDTAKEVLTELNWLAEVNKDYDNLVEENILDTGLLNPSALVYLRARPKDN